MTVLTTQITSGPIDFRYLPPDPYSIATIFRSSGNIQYVMAGNASFYNIRGAELGSAQGTVTAFDHIFQSGDRMSPTVETVYSFTGFNAPAPAFLAAFEQRDPLALTGLILGGADSLTGGGGDDYIWGLAGDDSIQGGAGADTLGGDDGRDWVRGGAGDDFVHGGAEFDDLHGNEGADTVSGREGDDWVVGGKDADQLFGDSGDDLVYGNLGADTCDGGSGADIVRGGQGDDSLSGGEGADFLAGDLGSDTVSGGAGGDVFSFHAAAGLDRVTDFNAAEGDRVQLEAPVSYSVSQVGADTLIDLGGGAQMLLVGVTLSSLPAGWIVVAG